MKCDIVFRSCYIDFLVWWLCDIYSMGSIVIGLGIVFLYDIMKIFNDRVFNIEKFLLI